MSTPQVKFKRAYRACFNCRKRKVKCLIANNETGQTICQRCKRENKECVMPETTNRGGIQNVLAGQAKRRREQLVRERVGSSELQGSAWAQKDHHFAADTLSMLSSIADEQRRRSGSDSANIYDIPEPGLKALVEVPLTQMEICARGILTPAEVDMYVRFFMKYMLPFYPFIPVEYRLLPGLSKLPCLLTTICCLTSRSFLPSSANGNKVSEAEEILERSLFERREYLHARLWSLNEILLGASVLAEPSPMSLGTIFSLLLLTQWGTSGIALVPPISDAELTRARRNERLAWMYVGQAVRLAQDMGYDKKCPWVFVALNISDTCLSARLGRKSMMPEFFQEPLPAKMAILERDRARCDLVRILGLASRVLYPSREETHALISSGNFINLVGMFIPHLDLWVSNYGHYLHDNNAMADSTVIVESMPFYFHFVKVYIFSMGFVPLSRTSSVSTVASQKLNERYMKIAVESARMVLVYCEKMHIRGITRFIPVSWCMRIMHSALFLFKAILFTNNIFDGDSSVVDTLDILTRTAKVFQQLGPDDRHLARRYGTILLNIVTEFKDSSNDNPSPLTNASASPTGSSDNSHSYSSSSSIPQTVHKSAYQDLNESLAYLRPAYPLPMPGQNDELSLNFDMEDILMDGVNTVPPTVNAPALDNVYIPTLN